MRIGLVLSGGFSRGAAQEGFIKAVCERVGRKSIKIISSSSIGSVNALALSANRMDEIDKIYKNIGFASLKEVRNKLKSNLFNNVIDSVLGNDFKLEIPFYVTGTCINTLSTHYFYINKNTDKNRIKKILDISITFPIINGILKKYENKFYIDGGATDNIPLFPFLLEKNNVDILLILHCYPSYIPPSNIINNFTAVIDVDVTARCSNVSSFSLSHNNLNYMFDEGYKYGKTFCEQVFANDDLVEIKKRGQVFIQNEFEIRKKNKPTFFSLVSILNKIHALNGFSIR